MDLVIFQETGYYPTYSTVQSGPATGTGTSVSPSSPKGSAQKQWSPEALSSKIAALGSAPAVPAQKSPTTGHLTPSQEPPEENAVAATEVSYYMPASQLSVFPDRPLPAFEAPPPQPVLTPEIVWEDESDYYPESALAPKLTESYVLRAPTSDEEAGAWSEVAKTIHVDAWFEGTDAENRGTIFVDGIAYRSGDKFERTHKGETFILRFEGIQAGQVVIQSLKRETR